LNDTVTLTLPQVPEPSAFSARTTTQTILKLASRACSLEIIEAQEKKTNKIGFIFVRRTVKIFSTLQEASLLRTAEYANAQHSVMFADIESSG
jgi:hypothetical protein